MLFICYPKCSTCQRAQKYLDENNVKYELRDIKLNNPTYEELKKWYQNSNLELKRFFNASGLLYKEYDLKNKIPNMTEDEQLKLLASNGMFVKRPILVSEDKILLGFKEEEWNKIIK